MKLPNRMRKGLEDFMFEDEVTEDLLTSTWSPTRGTDYLIFTNRRVVHVWYRLWAVDFDDFDYEQSVFDLDYGPVYDLLNIKIRGEVIFSMTVFATERSRILDLLHRIEIREEKKKKGTPPDFKTELEELASLFKEGILTEEEYESKKKEILDKI